MPTDPTPADLAKDLRDGIEVDADTDGMGAVVIPSGLASAIATHLDRLAALDASLADEWGVRAPAEHGVVVALVGSGETGRRVAAAGQRGEPVMRRRVTPWEVGE